MPYIAPYVLIAAVFSQVVYHSGADLIVPPPGWDKVDTYYDHSTGYYGEAWGERVATGDAKAGAATYLAIMQVNRGTPFPASGPRAPRNVTSATTPSGIVLPAIPLGDDVRGDLYAAVRANVAIVFGQRPQIADTADRFYIQIRQEFGPTVPVIETGSSLGGALSNSVVAAHASADKEVSALTFNALVYGNGIAGLRAAQSKNLPISNYYVGNELLTKNAIIFAIQWLTSGHQLGRDTMLADLEPFNDEQTNIIDHIIETHISATATSQVFESLYDEPVSTLYTHPPLAIVVAALSWLGDRFPTPSATRRQILRIINAPLAPMRWR
jgi:hypothetical protein